MDNPLNGKDPLYKSGPDPQLELFQRFCRDANGFSTEQAINAAANIIVNALRQAHGTRGQAEARFDEIFGRMKQLLLDHYDALGRKRGIFPYDQVIRPDFVIDKDGFNGKRH